MSKHQAVVGKNRLHVQKNYLVLQSSTLYLLSQYQNTNIISEQNKVSLWISTECVNTLKTSQVFHNVKRKSEQYYIPQLQQTTFHFKLKKKTLAQTQLPPRINAACYSVCETCIGKIRIVALNASIDLVGTFQHLQRCIIRLHNLIALFNI